MGFFFCRGFGGNLLFFFFGCGGFAMMADHASHGEASITHILVAMPAVSRSALVVGDREPNSLLAVHRNCPRSPIVAFDTATRKPRFDGCSCWAPGCEEGEVTICMATTYSAEKTGVSTNRLCVVEELNCLARSISASYRISHQIMQPSVLGSVPADRRFSKSDGTAAWECDVRAVPELDRMRPDRRLPPDSEPPERLLTPKHIAFGCLA